MYNFTTSRALQEERYLRPAERVAPRRSRVRLRARMRRAGARLTRLVAATSRDRIA